ncbi:MAG: DUF1998 domain-containing protein [Candidatus Marinimicrobia bacterium]|nr:DUF1998 domain-containing protein [Candidatus Neomarinimicrobiota bacterium]
MYFKKPIRRNQLISPWGIGSICNFPGDETLMVAGLDAWKEVYQQAFNPDEFIVREERLAKRLGVHNFRLPPDYRKAGIGVLNSNLKIPFVRFPLWHYCPRCGAMEKMSIYKNTPQKCKGPNFRVMSCHSLTDWKRPRLIPSRFIVICSEGHIEDFPFMEWVHRGPVGEDCKLRLRAGRSASSLSGIEIECVTCNIKRSMAGAFNEDSLKDIKSCSGQRPWLGEIEESTAGCGKKKLRVVQRGASNVYFPQLRSSIYLPKWESSTKRIIIEVLEKNWDFLTRTRSDGDLNEDVFKAFADKYNVDVYELLNAAKERLKSEAVTENDECKTDSEEIYRRTEYEAILKGKGGDNQDFHVSSVNRNEYENPVMKYFKSIVLVNKLRETRALVGFSRLLPDNGKTIRELRAELSISNQLNWLPAIIVKGEGVFFEFDNVLIDKWLKNPAVHSRFNMLKNNYTSARRRINPRFILIHTFAHVLINQFSYVCGYGSSALRERIYCDCDPETPDNPMNGVLIYTASGDSEGSLGGLVRQGKPGYLEDIVESALFAAQWCSADPICIDSTGQGPGTCNLAACHNCALLPETCCEEGNRLLDRGMLTGTPDNPKVGFFYGFDN